MARLGLIDDVVVIERRGVHELDGHRTRDEPRVGGIAEVAGEEHEHRAEPLAPRRDEMRRGLGQEVVVGADGLLQRLLDLVQPPAQRLLERGVGRLQSRHP